MRLLDLDAHWIYDVQKTSRRRRIDGTVEGAQGIDFQCPSCGAGKERGEEDGRRFIRGAHYIEVLFSNPRGVAPAPADCGVVNPANNDHPRWVLKSGSTFDDLVIGPSINCDLTWKDPDGKEHKSGCKFHGWVGGSGGERPGDVA